MYKDYIPTNAAKFDEFVYHFVKYVTNSNADWKIIPEKRLDELKEMYTKYNICMKEAIATPTKANNHQRNEMKKITTAEIRAIVNQYLKFDPVTDTDRINIGLYVHDNVRTARTNVTQTVEFEIRIKGTNNIIVDFWQEGSRSKAKPTGFSGAVIIWALSEEEPSSFEDYPLHTLATKTPYTIEFDNHDSGKRVWVKIAWQNARGVLGRWSEAKSAIIP